MKTRIQQIKERANDVRRSDDFGHSTQDLLHWQEHAGQDVSETMAPDIADLLAVVEVYRDALRNIRTGVGMGESELCSLIYKFAEQALKETGDAE